jgi:2-hydroxy-3-oxopropionate reductase
VPIGGGRDETYPRSVGILGLGFMALAVAERLLAVRPSAIGIVAYGRSPDLLNELNHRGAHRAASAADLAARSEVVVVLLDDLAQIEAYLAGSSGLVAGVHSPTTLIVGSPVSPDGLRKLSRDLAESTAGLLRIVDAPLSGPAESIAAGTLSIMVGAGIASYEKVKPVLDLLGVSVRVGPIGAGQVATASGQLLLAATGMALGEAAVLAERNGLDLDRLLPRWQRSEVASLLERRRNPPSNAAGQPAVNGLSMPAGVLLPWLRLAKKEAARTGTRADLLNTMIAFYAELSDEGLDDSDISVTRTFIARRHSKDPGRRGGVVPPGVSSAPGGRGGVVPPGVGTAPGPQAGPREEPA